MNIIAGYGLDLIVVAITTLILVFNRKTRKIANSYFLWMGISVFLLVWYIVFRFGQAWYDFGVELSKGLYNPEMYENSFLISKALMLDVCPLTGMLMPVLLIADPSRKAARSIAPLCLTGAFFTLFVAMPFNEDTAFTAHFIFIGNEGWPLYFFLHAANFILSFAVMANTPRFGWKGTLGMYGASIAIYLYIIICAYSTGCRWNCSGVVANDYIFEGKRLGEYHAPAKILSAMFGGIPYYCVPFVFFPLGSIWLAALNHTNDYIFKRFKHFQYPNQRSKVWYNWYKI